MKLKIYSSKTVNGIHKYWSVKTPIATSHYSTNEAAVQYAIKFITRWRKEESAYSMVQRISVNLLDVAGECFVQKLKRNKCKGISTKQYGYLKGIYERQQREW